MDFYGEFCCPCCDSTIGENDSVYMRDGGVIGCDWCIDHELVHIVTEEELKQQYYEEICEEQRISRLLGLR